MSRYTGPKARINRRLGALIFENSGAARAFDRRESVPGMHQMRRKPSVYGLSLKEKQKIKYYYGLGERPLRKLYDLAQRKDGNTGENLLVFCERRLDNIIRRAGFTLSRPQARQGVCHGHFTVNGHKCDIPSYQVRAGDVIAVKQKAPLAQLYRGVIESRGEPAADFLSVDPTTMSISVHRLPTPDDVSLPVEVGMVIELLSR
ncbi:MAG: 30S ribosomal protein S4 [Pirellulales bacterium]